MWRNSPLATKQVREPLNHRSPASGPAALAAVLTGHTAGRLLGDRAEGVTSSDLVCRRNGTADSRHGRLRSL